MIFSSLLVGKIVDRAGHAKILSIGTLAMSISVAAYSVLIYLDENWQVITFSIFLRIL